MADVRDRLEEVVEEVVVEGERTELKSLTSQSLFSSLSWRTSISIDDSIPTTTPSY